MIQLRHMQWLLVVLIVSSLILLVVSSFSTVSGFSSCPPISFPHFTSFHNAVFKTDENAYIFHIHFYIHIPFSCHAPLLYFTH